MFYTPHSRESGHAALLESWKECAQDCSYDCTATLQRAVKVKPFVTVHFPLP